MIPHYGDMVATASTLYGLEEIRGQKDHPLIVGFHWWGAGAKWFVDDETPWCGSGMCAVARFCNRERPKAARARARSWLEVGRRITLEEWRFTTLGDVKYNTVAVIKRSGPGQPGVDVIGAPGHVGLIVGLSADKKTMALSGGNQNNQWNVAHFPLTRLLALQHIPLLPAIKPYEGGFATSVQ